MAKEHYLLYEGIKYASMRYYIKIRQVGKLAVPISDDLTIEGATAEAIAAEMVKAAQAKLFKERRRPESFTGRLSAALADPRGQDIRKNKIELFKVSFLDEHVPYWRAIDQGLSTGFVGRLLTGLFTSGGELTPFVAGAGHQRLYRPGATSRGGKGATRRSPKAASRARVLLRQAGYPYNLASNVSGVVHRPIIAENYIVEARKAFHRADAQKLTDEAMKAFFAKTHPSH